MSGPDTKQSFAAFRKRLDLCELVALADVSTGTILVSDSAIKLGQEHLDRLCDDARVFLGPADAVDETFALKAGPTGIRAFVRVQERLPEVLCLVFAPDADIKFLEAFAMDFLRAVDRAQGEACVT